MLFALCIRLGGVCWHFTHGWNRLLREFRGWWGCHHRSPFSSTFFCTEILLNKNSSLFLLAAGALVTLLRFQSFLICKLLGGVFAANKTGLFFYGSRAGVHFWEESAKRCKPRDHNFKEPAGVTMPISIELATRIISIMRIVYHCSSRQAQVFYSCLNSSACVSVVLFQIW